MEDLVNPIELPLIHPVAFWTLAAVVTLYHSARAWVGKGQAVEDENARRQSASDFWGAPIPTWQRVFIHQIHDALFHVVCCVAGFASVFAFAWLFRELAFPGGIAAGAGVLMVFLAIFGVAGVAGILPPMLLFGRAPFNVFGQSN